MHQCPTNIIVWSYISPSAYTILTATGELHADPAMADPDLSKSYDWLRNVHAAAGLSNAPLLWGYVSPSLIPASYNHHAEGTRLVTLSLPSSNILVHDYDVWSYYVLNNWLHTPDSLHDTYACLNSDTDPIQCLGCTLSDAHASLSARAASSNPPPDLRDYAENLQRIMHRSWLYGLFHDQADVPLQATFCHIELDQVLDVHFVTPQLPPPDFTTQLPSLRSVPPYPFLERYRSAAEATPSAVLV